MYPEWKKHEYKAFQEAVESRGWSFEYLAISVISRQAVVRIIPKTTDGQKLTATKGPGLSLKPSFVHIVEI